MKRNKKIIIIFPLILIFLLIIGISIYATKQKEIIDEVSTFNITYLDVGQGDCAIVECDGKYMIIDGGPSSASETVYYYLKDNNINNIEYLICTHPDEDHIGGLSNVFNASSVNTIYCPTEKDNNSYKIFEKTVLLSGNRIDCPNEDDSFMLGSAKINVLSVNYDEGNNASIVLMINYGNSKFLMMGDAEKELEDYLIEKEYDLSCDVIKIAHHGSMYSTGYYFLYNANPDYAIISCGKDNSYGHPSEEVISKLEDADVEIYRTDIQGDIHCTSDKVNTFCEVKYIDLFAESGNEEIIENKEIIEISYIINMKSNIFHLPDCSSVKDMNEKNKYETSLNRQILIDMEFNPCKSCNP